MYFNYHAKAKKLIRQGHCIGYKFVKDYRKIKPCLLLYFDDESVMPIREHKFAEYRYLLFENNIVEITE